MENITISFTSIDVEENAVFICKLNSEFNNDGYIYLEYNGIRLREEIINNIDEQGHKGAIFQTSPIMDDKIKLAIAFCQYENKIVAYGTTTFQANKISSFIIGSCPNSIVKGNDITITCTVPSDATGYCIVEYFKYVRKIDNGVCTILVNDIKTDPGTYTYEVKYYGDHKYNESTSTITFTVTSS